MSELPRILCYARSSTKEQDESPKCQADRMMEKCTEMEAKGEGIFYKLWSENKSAKEIPWSERPEFSKLAKELEETDIVLCWTLASIDRNPIRMLNFAEYCMNRNVRLFLLKEPFMHGSEVELTTAMGRAFLHMGAIFNDFWMEHHQEATRSALAWRKKNGMISTAYPIKAKRRIYKMVDEVKVGVADEWDIPTCQLYAEIYTRWKFNGESLNSIARDFNRRQERSASGELICPTSHKEMPKQLQSPNYFAFGNIWKYIKKEIEDNDGMMGDIKVPYLPDVTQMQVKPVNSTRKGYFILKD